jgi:hypothetical protein
MLTHGIKRYIRMVSVPLQGPSSVECCTQWVVYAGHLTETGARDKGIDCHYGVEYVARI